VVELNDDIFFRRIAMSRVGLLAGIGTLPVEFIKAAHMQGYEVVCVALIPGIDPRLQELADVYYDINVAKLNKIIKTLVKEGVKEVTMLGKVTKEWLFKGLRLPDMRAIKLLKNLHNRKDDTIMLAIVDELAKDGISVLDQTKYLKPLMPAPQVFTKKKPTEAQMKDVEFGFEAAKQIGGMDLGQTVVVKNMAVMAVEAIEGTDACIRRGGQLARGDAVVVKTAKPGQDPRFDVPTVGMTTLRSMEESGCRVLAIEAWHTIFAEQEEVIKEADRKGMVILSVEMDRE
jgi:DUF1009 family protein